MLIMNKKQCYRQRLIDALCVFLPLFTITSGVLFIFYSVEINSKNNAHRIHSSHIVNLQRSKIASNFNLIVSDLLFFANYSQLLATVEDPKMSKQRLTSDLALFCRGSKLYDQIRIIDANGNESIRINYILGEKPVIVNEDALQSKGERYYFKDTFKLRKGEVFVSPLDLNIEHGKIEMPLKPVVRFSTPIFNSKNQKCGIITFNYFAADLIQGIKTLTPDPPYQSTLVNSDGYWLMNSSSPHNEWGFMFDAKKNLNMKIQNPDVWGIIAANDSGQFSNDKGLYTYTTIYPLKEGWQSSYSSGHAFKFSQATKQSEDYFWKIILFAPDYLLTGSPENIRIKYILFDIFAFIIFVYIAFILARTRFTTRQAVLKLHQSHSELETKVKERTEELIKTNKTFQALVESTVGHIDQDFFDNLVNKLGQMLGCKCTIVSMITGPSSLKTLAMKLDDKTIESYSYELAGTPCNETIQKGFCYYPENLCHFFPGDFELIKIKAVGYVGTPIIGSSGETIGVLCAISRSRLELPPNTESTMSILAARTAAEIERIENERESSQLALKLQQTQKMEAIGTLAGGIAHDFNNILSIILGYTEMAMNDRSPDSSYSQNLENVLQAGNRAKDLVHQILAFSRQAQVEKAPLKPQTVLKEALKMLRSSLPTTIEIQEDISKNCGSINADSTQFHQIIMNLCTNAFQAMEKTGGILKLSLKTADTIPEELLEDTCNTDTTYIELSCSDTGEGISPQALNKIFEPFFTTKEKGKGTGMGLAITYGIVKESGGIITVDSQPDKGTTFRIFLPQINQPAHTTSPETAAINGNERILFVDDEKALADVGKYILEDLGYNVTCKQGSFEALEAFRNQPDAFDLVITDQTMPSMTGLELSQTILQIRPDMPIILCTGYSSLVDEKLAKAEGIKEFALKPITINTIGRLIRNVLDSTPAPVS